MWYSDNRQGGFVNREDQGSIQVPTDLKTGGESSIANAWKQVWVSHVPCIDDHYEQISHITVTLSMAC